MSPRWGIEAYMLTMTAAMSPAIIDDPGNCILPATMALETTGAETQREDTMGGEWFAA